MEYLEEMNSPSNLRIVVSKLTFRLRERWRVIAFDIQEREGRRAKFSDFVTYINRQAKIALDPLFGDVKESFEGKKRASQALDLQREADREELLAVPQVLGQMKGMPQNLERTSRQATRFKSHACTATKDTT